MFAEIRKFAAFNLDGTRSCLHINKCLNVIELVQCGEKINENVLCCLQLGITLHMYNGVLGQTLKGIHTECWP
jgi:hypothetical protein